MSGLLMRPLFAAGLYGDVQIASLSGLRARGARRGSGSRDPVSSTALPLPLSLPCLHSLVPTIDGDQAVGAGSR